MKALLDLAPAAAFLIAYFAAKDLYVATAVLIVASFALVGFYRIHEKRWHVQHGITALLVGVFGGLTLAVHDPLFIKIKPTVLYLLFALLLLGSHFVGERVLLARLGGKSFNFPEPLWRRINLAWGLFFVLCAALNLYVAFNFSEAAWVKIKTFGFTGLMFVFMLAHAPFVARYLEPESSSPTS